MKKLFYFRDLTGMLTKRIHFFSLWLLFIPPFWYWYNLMNHYFGLCKNLEFFQKASFNWDQYASLFLYLVIVNFFAAFFRVCFRIFTYVIYAVAILFFNVPSYKSASESAAFSARITLITIQKYLYYIFHFLFFIVTFASIMPIIIDLFCVHDSAGTIGNFILTRFIYIIAEIVFPIVLYYPLFILFNYDIGSQMEKHACSQAPSAQSFNKLIGINFDTLDGYKFEEYCAILLTKHGYDHVAVTSKSNDYGVDIIAYYEGRKIAVQCKRYHNTVGNSAIQEVVAGMNFYNCQQAIVITTNYFSKPAIKLAKANNVTLWDRKELQKKVYEASLIPD